MKRCILKTQVNLDTVQQTLSIPLLERGKQFEQVESIVKTLYYDFEKLCNANYFLIGSCLQGRINENWVTNLLRQYTQDAVVEIGADLNIRFKRLDLPLAFQLRQVFGMYLSKQQTKQLFDKLIENFSDSLFAFDFVLSLIVKRQKQLIKHMSANVDSLYFTYSRDSELELRF